MEIGIAIIGILFVFGVIIGLSARLSIIEELLDSNINGTNELQNFEGKQL